MKNLFFYLSILSVMFFLSCSKDDIIDSKPGEPISEVTNLDYKITGDEVVLTWDLPSSYPDDIIQPVSVQINISIDGRKEGGGIILDDNPETYIYPSYDSSKNYRFTVKVMADVDTSEPYISSLRYSLGNTIDF